MCQARTHRRFRYLLAAFVGDNSCDDKGSDDERYQIMPDEPRPVQIAVMRGLLNDTYGASS
jgi:hypothetical protein